jgi:hypothetical protein
MRTSVFGFVLLQKSKDLTQSAQRKTGEHRDTNGTGFTTRAWRKPKAKAARFDETEPAATNSTATAKRDPSPAAAGSG